MKKSFLLLSAALTFVFACAQNTPSESSSSGDSDVPVLTVHSQVSYGSDPMQWLNVYQAKSDKPTPVYIWAHANSDGTKPPTANSYPKDLKEMLPPEGISAISWGSSVQQLTSLSQTIQLWEDMERVYQWVVDHAQEYNFDVNNIFVGGRSRGSIACWKFIHEHSDKIKGAYLTQGLPNGTWGTAGTERDPLFFVTDQSPLLVLAYRDGMETSDMHTPKNGQKVVDKYNELGIGDRIKLYTSLTNQGLHNYLVSFIKDNSR